MTLQVRLPTMREQRQDVVGCTPLEKTKQTYSILIYVHILKTALNVRISHFVTSALVPGYTRVVEWVLGKPVEL